MHLAFRSSYDLASFDLRDMIECGKTLRQVSATASSMEDAAGSIVSFFYRCLQEKQSGDRNCTLVRCFKTHRYGQLPADLQAAARNSAVLTREPDERMPVLTLLASAGDLPEWNDRKASQGHAAMPLESVDFVERAPMIAALLRQMGMSIEGTLNPSSEMILDSEQRAFNVFYVPTAVGDARIPAQETFVRRYGIKSVLGFGGLLPSGELFVVILFARTEIPRETADMFRTIALGVKLALLPYRRRNIFSDPEGRPELPVVPSLPEEGPFGETEAEQIRSESATLNLLICALEQAALHQTERLKNTFAALQSQGVKVREQDRRLGAMLEATSESVFLLDREWRFTFLNRHAQETIAKGRELLGRNIWETFPEAVGSQFWTQYHRVMSEGIHVDFLEHYPDPLDKWFEVHAFPIEDGMAAFFRDVTTRLKTETALRQTEKLAATGRLAASIAHEINNPLEAVTNLLYLLGCDEAMGRESREYVHEAENELRRVSEITTHMLRFYRQSTSATEVDLCEILESVLVLFGGRLTRGAIRLEKRFQTTRRLMGFSGELRQVFANLVNNALDASREGDRLILSVRDAVHPGSGREGVRVTIADTGSGMSNEVQRKVFEPFFTTKGSTGTGLGLWVSLELIRKHGGSVTLRSSCSADAHGTVFSLFFPLDAPARMD